MHEVTTIYRIGKHSKKFLTKKTGDQKKVRQFWLKNILSQSDLKLIHMGFQMSVWMPVPSIPPCMLLSTNSRSFSSRKEGIDTSS